MGLSHQHRRDARPQTFIRARAAPQQVASRTGPHEVGVTRWLPSMLLSTKQEQMGPVDSPPTCLTLATWHRQGSNQAEVLLGSSAEALLDRGHHLCCPLSDSVAVGLAHRLVLTACPPAVVRPRTLWTHQPQDRNPQLPHFSGRPASEPPPDLGRRRDQAQRHWLAMRADWYSSSQRPLARNRARTLLRRRQPKFRPPLQTGRQLHRDLPSAGSCQPVQMPILVSRRQASSHHPKSFYLGMMRSLRTTRRGWAKLHQRHRSRQS